MTYVVVFRRVYVVDTEVEHGPKTRVHISRANIIETVECRDKNYCAASWRHIREFTQNMLNVLKFMLRQHMTLGA